MRAIKNIKILLCIVILELCFNCINIHTKLDLNYMLVQHGGRFSKSVYYPNTSDDNKDFDIKFKPSMDNISNNSNIVFLSDGSFTVGNRLGVPKIYSDGITNGRYGIITSEIIETKQLFKSIIVKIDQIESVNGEAMVVFRAKDIKGDYTGWFGFDGHIGNKVTFYPYKQYSFLECMVSILTNDANKAPIIKSISVKLCN